MQNKKTGQREKKLQKKEKQRKTKKNRVKQRKTMENSALYCQGVQCTVYSTLQNIQSSFPEVVLSVIRLIAMCLMVTV